MAHAESYYNEFTLLRNYHLEICWHDPAAPLEGKQAAEVKRRKERLFRRGRGKKKRKMCGWCVSGTMGSSHMNPDFFRFITSCCHMVLGHSGSAETNTFCRNLLPKVFTVHLKAGKTSCFSSCVSSVPLRVPGNVLSQTCLWPLDLREPLSLCRHTKDAVSVCWVKCHGLMRDYQRTHKPPPPLLVHRHGSMLRWCCHFLTGTPTLTALTCFKVRKIQGGSSAPNGRFSWKLRADLLSSPSNHVTNAIY